jgi:carboxypeptidase PM20D1
VRRLSRIIVLAIGAAAVLGAGLTANMLHSRSRQLSVAPAPVAAINATAAAQRLAGAIRLRTVSYETPSPDSRAALLELHRYLATAFPHVHAALALETVHDYSLLYRWEGTDTHAPPVMLMAHQDVVPIAPGTESAWHAEPFGGEIRDGYVWGRGAWDDKGNLLAILEAVERLTAEGFRPARTIYLAFGHDEENGGDDGAAAIATLLRSRGVHLGFVLDEGMLITEGMVPGLDAPAALIGVAEKGSVTLRLTANATPGHSSMPGSRTAIGALATALSRLERAPMHAAIRGTAAEMFDTLAPEMHGANRFFMTNRWLFGRIIEHGLAASPATAALMRTTTAETIIRGGNKQNVLPGSADAWVNFRLLPGDDVDDVLAHVRRVTADPEIVIRVEPGDTPASPVSATRGEGYRAVEHALRALEPEVVVAPGLLVGGTDSRHMQELADGIYRFSPVRATSSDLARFHGTDERISIVNYVALIRFYERLIRDSGPSGR